MIELVKKESKNSSSRSVWTLPNNHSGNQKQGTQTKSQIQRENRRVVASLSATLLIGSGLGFLFTRLAPDFIPVTIFLGWGLAGGHHMGVFPSRQISRESGMSTILITCD